MNSRGYALHEDVQRPDDPDTARSAFGANIEVLHIVRRGIFAINVTDLVVWEGVCLLIVVGLEGHTAVLVDRTVFGDLGPRRLEGVAGEVLRLSVIARHLDSGKHLFDAVVEGVGELPNLVRARSGKLGHHHLTHSTAH